MRSWSRWCVALLTVLCAACSAAEPGEGVAIDESTASVEEALLMSCSSNAQCGSTSYCQLKQCAAPGTCATKPATCTTVVAPVCGCDGKTYSNSCMAAKAGVSVRSNGACIILQ